MIIWTLCIASANRYTANEVSETEKSHYQAVQTNIGQGGIIVNNSGAGSQNNNFGTFNERSSK